MSSWFTETNRNRVYILTEENAELSVCYRMSGVMELSGDDQISESVVSQTADDARETMDHPWSELRTITAFDGNGTRLSVSDINGSTLSVNTINNGNQENGFTQRVNPSTSILIESLVHQLCAAFEKNKERRKKIYQGICNNLFKAQLIDGSYNMTEFDILRKQHRDAFYNLVKAACAAAGSEIPLSIPATLPKLSRYYQEFTEISFIGDGGFGKVYKARNCLDRIEYAIKKIFVSSKQMKIINQHLNEVHALAKLNHPNIVPYKAAWIEPSFISRLSSADSRSYRTQTGKRPKRNKSRDSKIFEDSSSDENSLNSKDNTSVCKTSSNTTGKQRVEEIVEESEIQEESTSDEISFRNSNSDSNSDKNEDVTIDNNSDNSNSDSSSSMENTTSQVCAYSNGDQYIYTLYIQMALCEQTLENWMRGRINRTPLPVISEIFQQILRGVHYMHSQNVIHHDIKPSNIFISSSGELQIQLGDFGLACPLQGEEYHNVLGTRMYAAPEQLAGRCDPKSDIYSVGIVLTELLILTRTQMELIEIIDFLKCGNIPASLSTDRYKWAQIIVQMVQEDPQKRPWTQQLLQDINADKDVTITELKNTVMTLKDDINSKEHEIEKLQSEIALLKEKVKNLETTD
ncbi:eukaryotic translation initiation factor 2-alpha kinase 1-like isoform X1 [Pseudomyrmex gracilis]|uniref:eukaryotic translation initiation factor 2-alpha kinase 1-like isoform X1 n=1 Tax=Pseudomyrmex gracilis TaxID=219809 RepID=UPI0009952C3C|nr:eukaryotic translation initiation factor 2-alpha kinase 1-like isoform X1 [Pseudomyrmex gracilis]